MNFYNEYKFINVFLENMLITKVIMSLLRNDKKNL